MQSIVSKSKESSKSRSVEKNKKEAQSQMLKKMVGSKATLQKESKESKKSVKNNANFDVEEVSNNVDGKDLWMATNSLHKAKSMRNYFEIERDRIIAFWNITKKEIEDVKLRLQERENEKIELVERHARQKQLVQQRMRHFLFEENAHMESLKQEAENVLISKQSDFSEEERLAEFDVESILHINSSTCTLYRTQLLELTAEQDKEIAEQQNEFEHEMQEIQFKYEREMRELREQMDEARREELQLLNKRKEDHITELRAVHEHTYQQMKDYYGEITSNNLEMIRTLKDEVYARRRTDAHNAKAMREVAQKNKKLTEPLIKLEQEKQQLSADVENYPKDKLELEMLKRTVVELEQTYNSLNWEHEVLLQRYTKLIEDRSCILGKFNAMLQKIQQKSSFRRVLIQKKLEIVQNQLENKEAKLTELLKRANISAEDLKVLEQKIHDLLSEKDKTIEELHSLLQRMTSHGDDVVSTYESYLQGNGVSGLAVASERTSKFHK